MRELRDAEAKPTKDNNLLTKDNKRPAKANKRLNAKKNGIRTAPDKDRTCTGKAGRPRGAEPTRTAGPKRIDRRETVDVPRCKKGRHLS